MPPWKPMPGPDAFEGENRLTKSEIASIASWVRAGAPEGNPSLAPRVPTFASGWQLGTPDEIVSLPAPYRVPPDGPDEYRCFVLPSGPSGKQSVDRYVRAFEFSAENSVTLHHALIFVDARRQPPPLDQYDCFGTPGFLPSAALGGWSPGVSAVFMPTGTAVHIPPHARLVMQLHFHPVGKAETIAPRIALYFADHPPSRVVMDVPLGSNRIDIPAGANDYQIRDHFELPVPVTVVGIIPHAHYLCRDMKGWAVLPDGRTRRLLWINDWDFNWQEHYRYKDPFTLPAGTEVRMEFTYDNSAGNARNPNHPPRRVVWGGSSTDEMAGLHLQVIPRDEADMHELGMALWGKVMRGVGGSFYRKPDPPE